MEEQIRLHHETASDKPNDPKQTGDRSLIDFDGKGGVVRDLP